MSAGLEEPGRNAPVSRAKEALSDVSTARGLPHTQQEALHDAHGQGPAWGHSQGDGHLDRAPPGKPPRETPDLPHSTVEQPRAAPGSGGCGARGRSAGNAEMSRTPSDPSQMRLPPTAAQLPAAKATTTAGSQPTGSLPWGPPLWFPPSSSRPSSPEPPSRLRRLSPAWDRITKGTVCSRS